MIFNASLTIILPHKSKLGMIIFKLTNTLLYSSTLYEKPEGYRMKFDLY